MIFILMAHVSSVECRTTIHFVFVQNLHHMANSEKLTDLFSLQNDVGPNSSR